MKRGQKDELPSLYFYIGQRIQQAREAAQMTQTDLAKKLPYIDRAAVSQIERGIQRIQLEDLYHVAMVLGVPVESLLPRLSRRIMLNTRQAFLEYLGGRGGLGGEGEPLEPLEPVGPNGMIGE